MYALAPWSVQALRPFVKHCGTDVLDKYLQSKFGDGTPRRSFDAWQVGRFGGESDSTAHGWIPRGLLERSSATRSWWAVRGWEWAKSTSSQFTMNTANLQGCGSRCVCPVAVVTEAVKEQGCAGRVAGSAAG